MLKSGNGMSEVCTRASRTPARRRIGASRTAAMNASRFAPTGTVRGSVMRATYARKCRKGRDPEEDPAPCLPQDRRPGSRRPATCVTGQSCDRDVEGLAGDEHRAVEGVELLDGRDHLADLAVGGEVGGDRPQGVALADHDRLGGLVGAGVVGGHRGRAQEQRRAQHEQQSRHEHHEPAAAGQPDLAARGGCAGTARRGRAESLAGRGRTTRGRATYVSGERVMLLIGTSGEGVVGAVMGNV